MENMRSAAGTPAEPGRGGVWRVAPSNPAERNPGVRTHDIEPLP